MVSATAFASGSTEPVRAAGQLRLYSMRFCPFAHRSLLVLLAKQIPHEIVNINLASKPEWYLKKFPAGKVPALEADGVCVNESLIIAEYLDEAYPGRKLLPQDPYSKALDKMFIESFAYSPIFKAYFKKDQRAEGFEDFWKNAKVVETELNKRKTKFVSGADAPGFCDFMVWPFFQIAIALTKVFPDLKLPGAELPAVSEWLNAMLATREVQDLVDFNHHVKYVQGKAEKGESNFDIGL